MESKPPQLGGPFRGRFPGKIKDLAAGAHAALRAISLLRVGRDILREQGTGTKKGPTRPNPCLKKSLPLRIAFRLPGFLAALPVSWESPRHCWRRGERWRAQFCR